MDLILMFISPMHLFYLVAIIFLIWVSCFTVEQQRVAIIERFGKFNRVATAGLNVKIPLVEINKGYLSLRVQQLDVMLETKTKDNVFIHMTISVQFHVKESKIYDAFYRLTDAERQ